MLSVAEAAEMLGISTSRVRLLIKKGILPAVKVGKTWNLSLTDVLNRKQAYVKAGRPSLKKQAVGQKKTSSSADYHRLYLKCAEKLSSIPTSEILANAESEEEAAFYVAVSDFFIQQKQQELIKVGAF